MITDDERREVARKLRGLAENCDGVVWVLVERHLGLVLDERYSAGSVYTSESVSRLADLIEPEPERTCKVTYEYSGEQFPHCIHVKELSCGHEFRYYEPSHVPNYCPECGARVVS